jgi:coronin-1B/1C/6
MAVSSLIVFWSLSLSICFPGDIEKQAAICNFTDFGDVCQSFDWSEDGSQVVATCKDTTMRVFDPRQAGAVIKFPGFTGSKSSRALWRNASAGRNAQVIAVGSSKQSARQYGLWDIKMPEKPMTLVDIDTSAGVLIPHFDPDNSILYVAGKGDGNIRYFEIVNEDPYVHWLSEFRDNSSQKGVAWLPRRAVDTTKCEVAMAFRLVRTAEISRWTELRACFALEQALFHASVLTVTYLALSFLSFR